MTCIQVHIYDILCYDGHLPGGCRDICLMGFGTTSCAVLYSQSACQLYWQKTVLTCPSTAYLPSNPAISLGAFLDVAACFSCRVATSTLL